MYKVECLPYPKMLKPCSEIFNHLCYFIEPYNCDNILSVLIWKFDNEYIIKVLDKDANHLDPQKSPIREFINKYLMGFLELNHSLKINKSQMFFAESNNEYVLVDVYDSKKFIGPGMLRDIYGKRMKTQKVLEIKPYTKDMAVGNFIIKPSLFMTINVDNKPHPLYIKMGK